MEITTAKEMYEFVDRQLSHPNVAGAWYSWRKEGFDFYGDAMKPEDLDCSTMFACSEFMDKVIRTLSFQLRFNFFLHQSGTQESPRIWLHLNPYDLFHHHYGISKYDLESLIKKSEDAVYDPNTQDYGPPENKNLIRELQRILENGTERIKELIGKIFVFMVREARQFGFDIVKAPTEQGKDLLIFDILT